MSASRIGGAEGMDVDETEVALPTSEWMEAAQRAADTDGILENGPAKHQKVCNPCCTLTALHLQTLHKNAHKRESLSRKHECESVKQVPSERSMDGVSHQMLIQRLDPKHTSTQLVGIIRK